MAKITWCCLRKSTNFSLPLGKVSTSPEGGKNFKVNKFMKLPKILAILLIIASFLVGWYFYNDLPARVASHWNAAGEANGYSSRFSGAFLMPIISLVLFLILSVVPHFDPKKENIQKFRKYYDWFLFIFVLFFFYLFCLTLFCNLVRPINLTRWFLPGLGVLFFYAGILISKAEPNWTIGIRTPWTLSSPTVWQKTHVLGGKLFQISGIITLLSVFFPGFGFWLMFGAIMLTAFSSVIYSYFVFRKEKNNNSII
jgi:uncharacterized membrane protein